MNTLVLLSEVNFAYNSKNNALSGISLEINKGDIVGLAGPIGAGKTTLLRVMSGIYKTTSGKIIRNTQNISYLPSSRGLVEMLTVQENLNIWKCAYNVQDSHMVEVVNQLKLNSILHKTVSQLSSGMKQKTAIALSLLITQGLYLWDEPFVNMDFDTCLLVCELLKKKQMDNGMLLSSHNLEYLEQICNKLVFINKGSIVKTVEDYHPSKAADIKQLYIGSIKGAE